MTTLSHEEGRRLAIQRNRERRDIAAGRETDFHRTPARPARQLRDLGPPDGPAVAWQGRPTAPPAAPAPPIAEPTAPAPARNGTCRLTLAINGQPYTVRRGHSQASPQAAIWALKVQEGERAGTIYTVIKTRGEVCCTCPDQINRSTKCKHIAAMLAVGLIPPTRCKVRSNGGAS